MVTVVPPFRHSYFIDFYSTITSCILFFCIALSLERQVEYRINHEFSGIFPTSQEVLLDFFPRKDIDSHGTL